MTYDGVGNYGTINTITYYSSPSYTLYAMRPRLGYTIGNTEITVRGAGFSPQSVILINGEDIPTSYGGPNILYGNSLPLPEGNYDVQISDPEHGLSVTLIQYFMVVPPPQVVIPTEPEMRVGEIRKHIFDTDQGQMVLVRRMIGNFDVENILENSLKEMCVKQRMSLTMDSFPQRPNLES